jgi:hypothetical protein
VDLHQRLLPYAARDPLAERIRAGGATPENLVLYLCVNEVTHRFSKLKYLLDLDAHLRKAAATLRWEEVVPLAQELEVAPGVFYALGLALRLTGARVPEGVLSALRPPEREVVRVRRMLGGTLEEFAERCLARDGPAGARLALFCTRGGEARRRLLWRLLVPPEAYLRQELFADPGESLFSLQTRRLVRKLFGSRRAS